VAKIEINVDESVLKEAETVLDFVGMDVQTAVNIFLRRIIIERGLPMSMVAPTSGAKNSDPSRYKQEIVSGDSTRRTRVKNVITKEMVDEVWQAFVRYQKGLGEISSLSNEVADKSGMNRGSAHIYLNILSKLVKGELNTRTLKMEDLEYLMGKIKTELGEEKYSNAIQSLRQSIPYWREKLPGLFADKVEAYCDEHMGESGMQGES
jgi:DNA-damage-inducible protein J